MNKPISISLETLTNGNLRATGRAEGRTVGFFEGTDARLLVDRALNVSAANHKLPSGGYDMTFIGLNDAAAATLYPR